MACAVGDGFAVLSCPAAFAAGPGVVETAAGWACATPFTAEWAIAISITAKREPLNEKADFFVMGTSLLFRAGGLGSRRDILHWGPKTMRTSPYPTSSSRGP